MDTKPDEALRTQKNISLFVKEHIIPIAKQNNALIVTSGTNTCTLTNAIGKEARDVELQCGGTLPFSLVAICYEKEVWHKSKFDEGSFSYNIRNSKTQEGKLNHWGDYGKSKDVKTDNPEFNEENPEPKDDNLEDLYFHPKSKYSIKKMLEKFIT